MNILKYISVALTAVLSVSAVTACSSKKNVEELSEETSVTEESTEPVTEPVTEEITTEPPVEKYAENPVSYPEMEHSYASDLYEAERERLKNGLVASNERYGYSGGGYVTGFDNSGQKSVRFTFDAPATQHYDISFGIASDMPSKCRVLLNGSELYSFDTMSDGQFQKITHYGVFIEKGTAIIEICPQGDIMLDYLDIENSVAVNNINYEVNSVPVNPNASEPTKELMKFLADNYGKYTLTGQYVTSPENNELELIYKNTGQYPAIRFSVIDDTETGTDVTPENVDACVAWHEKGGINGITWEWKSPSLQSSVYAQECDFSILNAMTEVDIAKYSSGQIFNLYSDGYISEECYKLMMSIDEVAQKQLMPLKEKGIPILWRPLYDASLGYDSENGAVYWWGAGGADAYRWLWNLIYNRFTEYYGLDNLIWVWNGMSDVYTVDESTFDIASYDLYTGTDKKFGSRCEQFMSAQKYINNKIIAVSECDNVPDIDTSFRDNSVWSFFGLWYGEYISDESGNYSEKYTTKDELIRAYNSEGSLTLDEYKMLREGGQLSVGNRNFSSELQQEYTQPITETPEYGYNDYGYEDYGYNDYGYEDYGYNDYGYSEW